MKTKTRLLLTSATVMLVSGAFTSCKTADGGDPVPDGHYPPGYYAQDVVTTVPRPDAPGVKPVQPIFIPPPAVVRPMPMMAPMPRPALRR